jgi:hypothetical protein
MQGWVIVYLPGGNVYQMVGAPDNHTTKTQRLLKKGMRYAAAIAQVYWFFKT